MNFRCSEYKANYLVIENLNSFFLRKNAPLTANQIYNAYLIQRVSIKDNKFFWFLIILHEGYVYISDEFTAVRAWL